MSDVIAEPPSRSNRHLINRIRLIEGDLLAQTGIEALVMPISHTLHDDGPLHQAIIAKAGAVLDNYILDNVFKPKSGDVFAVPPFGIPVGHLLCCVLPEWKDNLGNEERDLTRGYRGVMELSVKMGIARLAMPVIGAQIQKFPIKRVARLGAQGIIDHLHQSIAEVRVICVDREQYSAFHQWLTHYGWEG